MCVCVCVYEGGMQSMFLPLYIINFIIMDPYMSGVVIDLVVDLDLDFHYLDLDGEFLY